MRMLDAALNYAAQGIPIFPCREKKPLTKNGFKDATVDPGIIRTWWGEHPDAQIGMPTGQSSHIMSIDLDSPAAAQHLEELEKQHGELPATRHIQTSPGRRQIHLRIPDGVSVKTVAAFHGVNGFDIRGEGGYVILVPSIHHGSGKPYQILIDETLAFAPVWAIDKFGNSKPRVQPNAPAAEEKTIPEGQRNAKITSLAGTLRHRGFTKAAARNALVEENNARCTPPLPEREVETIINSVWRYDPGTPATALGHPSEDWHDPVDLRPELPPVPTFDVSWLPECLRPLVEEISESMQIPVDFPASAITVGLAGVTGRRVSIRPKYADESWREPAVLWGAVIAPPRSLKTPALNRIVQPLLEIEKEWRADQKLEDEEYETAKARIEIEQAAWKAEVNAAIKASKPQPPRPESTIWEPLQRRILVTDATYESLHVILSQNPAGVLCTRDELSGFLAGLEADNRAAERPFWLSLWSGTGHHTLDRIGRGNIHVPNVCGSLFGNLVPTGAQGLVQAMASGKQDDGFLQRFSYVVWPDLGSWQWVDLETNPSAAQRWERIVRAIVALSGIDPLPMNFNPEAQQIFIDWYSQLQTKLRSDALHPAMQSHLAKYPKTLVVISAVYQLAEMADAGKLAAHAEVPQPYSERVRRSIRLDKIDPQPSQLPPAPVQSTLITVQNIERAISVITYLEQHAVRLYSCVSTPQLAASHNLARHLRRGDLDGTFSKRDIARRGWTGLQDSELIEAATNHLTDLNWLRMTEVPTTTKGGRPSFTYEVNPKVVKVAK
jgi:hypothetical protein